MSRHIRTVPTSALKLNTLPPIETAQASTRSMSPHQLLLQQSRGVEAGGGRGGGEPHSGAADLEARWERLQSVEQNAFMTPRERQRFVKDLQALTRGYRAAHAGLMEKVSLLESTLEAAEQREAALTRDLEEQGAVTAMYEEFEHVPISLSGEALQRDIETIENDIRVNELVTDEPQALIAPPLPQEENGRKWALMELKFERLDQLIVVLKKKLLRFEANEHLARVVEEYGDLPHIIRDNNRLKHENTKLRSREQRFACDPLLNRYFGETDATFLRVLTMALQNELTAHRALVAKHNLASNPNAGVVSLPGDALPDPTSLADLDIWLQDPLLRNDFGDELRAWREANMGASPPSQVSSANALSLLQELNRMKEANELLVAQVERLEEERTLSANVGIMRKYCQEEFAHPLKGLAKKQFQDINEKLLAELKAVNSKFAQAESTLAMQTGILAQMSDEKQTLMEENVLIGKRVISLLKQNKELHKRLEKTSQLCHSLYLANLSTIQGVLVSKLPPGQMDDFVAHFHRDVLLTYLSLHTAATKIQSWFRGVRVRRRLKMRYAFVARAALRFKRHTKVQPLHSSAASHGLGGPGPGPASDAASELSSVDGDGADGAAVAVASTSVSASTAEAPVPAFLPVLHTLSRIILHVDADIRTVLQIKSVLAICRLEIQEQLKPSMELELARWQRYIDHKHGRLNQVVQRVLKPKETADFAQQFLSRGVDAGTQTEDENADDAPKKRGGRSSGSSDPSGKKKDRRKRDRERRHR